MTSAAAAAGDAWGSSPREPRSSLRESATGDNAADVRAGPRVSGRIRRTGPRSSGSGGRGIAQGRGPRSEWGGAGPHAPAQRTGTASGFSGPA